MFKNRKNNYPLYNIRDLGSLRQLIDEGATMYGEKPAFRYRTGKSITDVSYIELRHQMDSFGTALCVLGLESKHIAIIGNNRYEWVLAYLAVLNSNAVVVPIDKDLSNEETRYILDFAECSAVIYSKSVEEKINALTDSLPNITHYICMDEPSVTDDMHYSMSELLKRGMKLLDGGDKRYLGLSHDVDDLKELLFTSGTTGKSKGVMLSESCLCFNIVNSQKMMWISDTCLSVLPYHHAYESTCGILTMLHHGMSICINESLRTLLPNFKVYHPTEVQLVPLFLEKFYRAIWDKIDEKGKTELFKKLIKTSRALLKVGIDMRGIFFRDVLETFGGKCKSIICGGAPLKPYIAEFFTDIGITLINGYGISECGPLVTVNRPEFHDYGSVGLPLPGVELMIYEPNENGEGEICVKGPNVMLGYYKNPEATKKVIIDGWFHTGDMGRIGHDGFLFITGRIKNMIVLANGKNVYPEEIEDRLAAMSEYIDEVVISSVAKGDLMVISAEIYPNRARAEQKGVADVEKLIHDTISKYNDEEPPYKAIKNIVFRDTPFEKTTTNKIKRKYNTK